MEKNIFIIIIAGLVIISCSKNKMEIDSPLTKQKSDTVSLKKTESVNVPNIFGFKTPNNFQEKNINVFFSGINNAQISFNLFSSNYDLIRNNLGEVEITQVKNYNEYTATYDGFIVTFQKDAPIVLKMIIKNQKFSITNGIKIGTSRDNVYKLLPDGFSKYNVPHQTNVVIDDPSYYYYLEFGWDVLPGSFGRGIKIHFNSMNEVDEIFLGNVGFSDGEE